MTFATLGVGRRGFLCFAATSFGSLFAAVQGGPSAWAATPLVTAEVKPELSPNQAEYDPTDEQLREAAGLLQQALNTSDVKVRTFYPLNLQLWGRTGCLALLSSLCPFDFLLSICCCTPAFDTDALSDRQLQLSADLLLRLLLQVEEELFTRVIDQYGDSDAKWKADVVGRALGNRGNARSRQGRLDEALSDYNQSIELCPWSVDPVLNR